MAFLGDFGKIFLGGARTGQVVQSGASLLGVDPIKAAGIGSAAQGLADTASRARQEVGQSTARSQATQTLPQETQASGSIDPFAMSNGFQQAIYNIPQMPMSTQQSGFQQANILPFIMGGGALLGAAGAAIDLFFTDPITGQPKRKKITRKFKAQVKQAVQIVGLEETANMLNTTPNIIVQILLKRFRNDGPYITKAAVRKTKATVRKMETVNMLTKEIAKLAGSSATRRRATTGTRASSSRKTTVIQ